MALGLTLWCDHDLNLLEGQLNEVISEAIGRLHL